MRHVAPCRADPPGPCRSGDVTAAIRADRRSLKLLTGAYVICGGLLMVLTLT